MDVLKNSASEFSNQFSSTLTTDASPSHPRIYTRSPPSPSTVNIEDVTDKFDKDTPPIVTEPQKSPDSPPIPPLRRKAKKKTSPDSSKAEDMPVPPIHTTTTGSVINIVNSKGIHWGPEITYNFGATNPMEPEKSPDAAVRKTKSIVAVMESQDEIQHEHMECVSRNLGSGWRTVARSLGYEDGMLELLFETHQHKGVPEVIYQLLLDWTRTDSRTLGQLCTQLWRDGKRAVVRDVANLHKSQAQ